MTRATLFAIRQGPAGTRVRWSAYRGIGGLGELPTWAWVSFDARLSAHYCHLDEAGAFRREDLEAWLRDLPPVHPPRSLHAMAVAFAEWTRDMPDDIALRIFIEHLLSLLPDNPAAVALIRRE
jgi:hypothetical protein